MVKKLRKNRTTTHDKENENISNNLNSVRVDTMK